MAEMTFESVKLNVRNILVCAMEAMHEYMSLWKCKKRTVFPRG